jgi:hypothetical protein
MLQQYFLMYAGGSLAGAIALVAITKSYVPSFAQSLKKPLIRSILLALLIAGLQYLAAMFIKDLFTLFWFFTAIFITGASIFRLLTHKKYFTPAKEGDSKVFAGEILFTFATLIFAILFFSCLQYFVAKEKDFLFYPVLMSGLTFFLPLLIMNAFEAAWNIPAPGFNNFEYPAAPIPYKKPGKDEVELLIAFEIAKKTSDRHKKSFRIRGFENMLLGDLFYHFVNVHNEGLENEEETIEVTNENKKPHIWWFYRKVKWYQRPFVFDPKLDLYKNLVKENTVIICERL